jgi:hypothetical protein
MGWHTKASHKGWKMGTHGRRFMYVTIKTKKELANHKILDFGFATRIESEVGVSRVFN